MVEIWITADWQERETWDQYGIVFAGHPNLKRLLNHHEFLGHPLRKDFPARATEFDPFSLTLAKQQLEEEAARVAEDLGKPLKLITHPLRPEIPLYLGADTHALSEPARVTALEVFAAMRAADHVATSWAPSRSLFTCR